MSAAFRGQAGVTLPELIIVLVMLGLMAGIVGLSLQRERTPPASSSGTAQIAAARHQALISGRAVRIRVTIDGRSATVAALPDGRVIAPPELHLDVLTGMPIRE